MKSAAFAYQRPASVIEAVRVFGQTDAAKPIGGGQSLGPMLNLRLVRAQLLVDVSGLDEIRTVEQKKDGLWIGGATTHAEIEDGKLDSLLGQSSPLAQMLRHIAGTIAYRAVRNRGTMAGSLAHADPAADWVLTMMALDAQLQCVSAQGQRTIRMSQFMSGAFTTALGSGDLLTGVLVPQYSNAMRWGYYKFCRKTGEFAEASCASVFDPERGIARIAIGALDGAPALLPKLAADIARSGIDALSDAAVKEAVAQATPGRDEIGRRLIVAAVKRSVRQALGAT
ncbi:MAG: aerobic carbon-monoxide dehydrogenase medium subunit [Burkholderiales bacterium]|jgi:carbon-monoxide dehydrogenase medium subunit